MASMTSEEIREFLAKGTRTGKLATSGKDGRPHVVPVWFVLDGSDLVFTTMHSTKKARNIRENPRVSICVDVEQPPFSFVQVNGDATLIDDRAQLLSFAMRIGGRYMGESRAEEFGQRNAVEGELVVRVVPVKTIAEKNLAD